MAITINGTTNTIAANITGNVTGNVTGNATGLTGSPNITVGSVTASSFSGNGTIPVGGIIMWSGSVATIPSSWRLCNGANGTPNLQDRFIVGAGSGYAVGAIGGSANATLVAHSHTATSTATDSGHTHNWGYEDGLLSGGLRAGGSPDYFSRSRDVKIGYANVTVSTTISTEGSSATNANLPPYYALAFIMRTA